MRKVGLFIGLSTLDIIHRVRRYPTSNEKVSSSSVISCGGGPAFNAAITHALLGGESYLLTKMDSSVGSNFCKEEAELYGVKIFSDARCRDFSFPVSSVIISECSGERAVISGSRIGATASLTAAEVFRAISASNPDFLLIDGHYIDVLSIGSLSAKIPIVLDAGSWKSVFERLIGPQSIVIAGSAFSPPDMGARAYCRNRAVSEFAVTNGGEAIEGFSNNEEFSIKPPVVTVVDTLGAGDIFHGAFAYFYFNCNSSFRESLRLASEVAAASCQYKGPRQGLLTQAK